MNSSAKFARKLLRLGTVTIRPDDPFEYSSGMLGPVYNDVRLLLSDPTSRKEISLALELLARKNVADIDVIAGTATTGVPWASWVAAGLNLPMIYIRAVKKQHGQLNQIEGSLEGGSRVLIVQDLVTTGNSCFVAADAIRAAGGEPVAVISIFNFNLESTKSAFEERNLDLYSVTDFLSLIDVALQGGWVTDDSYQEVISWAENPQKWKINSESK